MRIIEVGSIATVVAGTECPDALASLPRAEREWCSARRTPDRLLARLAARRALAQLGVADGPSSRIEIRREACGRPEVWLAGGNVDALTGSVGRDRYGVSLSHDRTVGVAAAAIAPSGSAPMSIGVDVVAAERVQRWSESTVEQLRLRVLTTHELRDGSFLGAHGCAAAIAAKEAVGKATRHVDGSARWHDVELVAGASDSTWHWTLVRGSTGLTGHVDVVESDTAVVAVTAVQGESGSSAEATSRSCTG